MEQYFFSKEAQTLSGLSADDLKKALQNDEGELVENAASQFNSLVLKKFKASEDEAFNKGFRKKAATIEKAAKPVLDHYGIASDTIEDALTALLERVKEEPGTPGPDTLTTEQLRKLPQFQSELDARVAKIKSEKEKVESDFAEFKAKQNREKVETLALQEALKILSEKKAAFAPDQVGQVRRVLSASGLGQVHADERGNLELLDSDGQPLRDANSNRITFSDFVTSAWTGLGLGFDDAPGGSGSPGAGGGGSGGGSGGVKITSFEQYQKARVDARGDGKKLSEIAKSWAEFQAGTK